MTEEKIVTQAEDTAIEPKDDQNKATDQNPPEDARPEEQDKPKKTAWYTRVIAREAAEKREAKREADLLRSQLASVLQEKSDPNNTKALTQVEIERLADEKATQREFTKACNKLADLGSEEFDDFDASVGTLQQIGGNYQGLLQIVTELDDGHKILHELGKDPEEAERLLSLPPTKMALAIAKLETKISKAKEKTISDVPPPITPIKPKASKAFDPNDPNADRDEWSKWREKTRRKR